MFVLELNARIPRLLSQMFHGRPWRKLNEVQNAVVLHKVVFVAPIQPRDNRVRQNGIGPEVDYVLTR